MQCYRRKPPSQVRRDQKRAEERKAKVCQQASDFSSLRLFETPPDRDASRPADDNTPLLDNGYNTAIDARTTCCDSSVLYIYDLCSGEFVIIHAEDSFCDIKQDKHCASLDPLNIVRNYVAELMDRPLQRRLRDTHRNCTQRRVVTNDNQDKPLMIFETDDMVFVCNPEGRSSSDKTGEITYWFSKQDPKRMLQEEMDFLQKLKTWRPTEKWRVPQYKLQRKQT